MGFPGWFYVKGGCHSREGIGGEGRGKICPNVLPLLVPGALSAAHHRLPCQGVRLLAQKMSPQESRLDDVVYKVNCRPKKGNGNKKGGGRQKN